MIEKIAGILGLDEEEVKKRLEYVGFTEEDKERLGKILSAIEKEDITRIFTGFYEHLLRFEETRKILEREKERINRLKEKQAKHFKELLKGKYDMDYALSRLRVGMVHEKEGIDPKIYTGAFAKWIESVIPLLARAGGDKADYLLSLLKAVVFDMTLSLDAYYFARIIKGGDVKYKTLFNSVRDAIFVADIRTMRIVDANRSALELVALPEGEVIGQELIRIHPPELHPIMKEKYTYAIKTGFFAEPVYLLNRQTNEWIPAEAVFGTFEFGGSSYLVGIYRDIRDRLEREEKLARLGRLYDALSGINSLVTVVSDKSSLLKDGVEIIKERGNFKYAGIFEADTDRIVAQSGTYKETDTAVCLSLNGNDRKRYYLLVAKHEREGFTPEETGLLQEIVHDLSFGLKKIASEEQISHLTFYDSLTGLPNRTFFIHKLKEVINASETRNEEVALIIADIDHFGEINQALGHNTGDEILKAVAIRIKTVARTSDFVARIGADEFALLLTSKKAKTSAEKIIERIKNLMDQPFSINSNELFISLSFGVSLFPSDADSSDSLFTSAVACVNRAKELGGNRTVYYSHGVSTATEEKLMLRTQLRKAIEKGEFLLYYQPKIDLKQEKVAGCEALLRWKKDGEIIPPSKFIPLLEEGELIHEVGEWVIKETCTRIGKWKEKGIDVPVAVNVSATQLKIPAFVDRMLYAISSCGGFFENFEVEITESTIMEDTSTSVEFLNTLASYGIKTYIDDFGTGYSSLAYLKKLPVYALKIDREFIKDLPHDKDDLEIVKATILLAKTFGLKTVAEGTETKEQIELLKELGCDYAQGYYFAKPMPADEFEEFFKNSL